jgi:hypothetical protein
MATARTNGGLRRLGALEPFTRAENAFQAQDQENGNPGQDQQLQERRILH